MKRTAFAPMIIVLAALACAVAVLLSPVTGAGQPLGPSHSVHVSAEDKGPTGTTPVPTEA